MKLIIGLGNIGKKYVNTRHNIGFLCLEKLAHKHNLDFESSKYYFHIKHKTSLLLMPKTYMNRSGNAYKHAVSKYGCFDEVLVVMDDIDLPVGSFKILPRGGSGGHNGLNSILAEADDIDIARIRIGIGKPESNTREYVLDTFTADESKAINEVLDIIVKWIDLYSQTGVKSLLDEYSKWKRKPIPSESDGIDRPKEEKV